LDHTEQAQRFIEVKILFWMHKRVAVVLPGLVKCGGDLIGGAQLL
jgi:hypothetical protein